MPTRTPWGAAQGVSRFGRGISRYHTASHGGFKVCETLNKSMPDHLRNAHGWYEEDCEWCKVVTAFPERFNNRLQGEAKQTLRRWHPKAYEVHYKVELQPGESFIKDEGIWSEKHKHDLQVVSAFGSWNSQVPDGMIGVLARVGGFENRTGTEGQYFLVPEIEYRMRGPFGFIVDPAKHAEIPPLI